MPSESLPRLRAPRDHGAILTFPPLDAVGALLEDNGRRLEAASCTIAGVPLSEVRRWARRQTLVTAQQYLNEAGEPIPTFAGDRLILAGHQPEIFHPGVWFKNFALQDLAARHRAVPLNLVVDNDTAKHAYLRVPHGVHIVNVPFDVRQGETPYEERVVQDESLFASLPARVEPLTRDWPFRPLLNDYWPEAVRCSRRTRLLGERCAAARRHFERAWGWQPLEAPLSRVCQTEAFAWFAVHVLRDLPRFHADYNASLQAYRQRHELRSPLHPVPELATDGPWLEAPFWSWRLGDTRRQRLWAHGAGDMVQLRAGASIWPILNGDPVAQVAQYRALASAGRKIRTRALTTTLFCRALLGDLFIHGIGGGKYDEVTDDILRRFLHLEPPGYLVLTATQLLPLERHPTAVAQYQSLVHRLRDVRWNPQRHLDDATLPAAQLLVADKQRWIDRPCTTAAERQERCRRLRQLTERLHAFAFAAESSVKQQLAEAALRRQLHEVRSSRDFAFCLFPEEMLREFYRNGYHQLHVSG